MKEVYGTIRKLGATSKYKGYYFVAEAIRMTMEFQERPMKITKDIYPRLAKKFKSKPSNIEHDIRTIVNVCWENHRERLEQIAGYPLEYRPTNSEFVDMQSAAKHTIPSSTTADTAYFTHPGKNPG